MMIHGIQLMTPYEMCSGRKPNLSRIADTLHQTVQRAMEQHSNMYDTRTSK
jgi:hypothetical protein